MRYYCIKQHDITDCGVACLATICKQNGYKIDITQICEVAGTDKQGTNAYGVIKAAKHLGFSAKGVKGNKESFFSEFPLPCIAVECPSKNGVSSTFMNRIMKTINKSNLSGKCYSRFFCFSHKIYYNWEKDVTFGRNTQQKLERRPVLTTL